MTAREPADTSPGLRPFIAKLPFALIVLRFLLALLCLSLALIGRTRPVPGWEFVAILIAAILSDIFDGVIARRVGVATALLRRFDSQTDLVFWLSATAATLALHPDLVRRHAAEFMILITIEAGCYAVSVRRFGREACTHAFSAKAYGLGLFIGFTAMLGFGVGGPPVHLMFALGLLSGLDVLAILLLLPDWGHDVPSSYHAWLIRQQARS